MALPDVTRSATGALGFGALVQLATGPSKRPVTLAGGAPVASRRQVGTRQAPVRPKNGPPVREASP